MNDPQAERHLGSPVSKDGPIIKVDFLTWDLLAKFSDLKVSF